MDLLSELLEDVEGEDYPQFRAAVDHTLILPHGTSFFL